MSKKSKVEILTEKLESLEEKKSFSKKDFITEQWGDYDWFLDRSFCVTFTHAKKLLPLKTFKTIKGSIFRIK